MHYLLMRAVAALMRAAIADGMFEVALQAAHQLLPYYKLAYPEVPLKLFQAITLL